MALLESNFENRLSFLEESTKMELHRELSYGRPNSSPRRAISALFFSVYLIWLICVGDKTIHSECICPWKWGLCYVGFHYLKKHRLRTMATQGQNLATVNLMFQKSNEKSCFAHKAFPMSFSDRQDIHIHILQYLLGDE